MFVKSCMREHLTILSCWSPDTRIPPLIGTKHLRVGRFRFELSRGFGVSRQALNVPESAVLSLSKLWSVCQ